MTSSANFLVYAQKASKCRLTCWPVSHCWPVSRWAGWSARETVRSARERLESARETVRSAREKLGSALEMMLTQFSYVLTRAFLMLTEATHVLSWPKPLSCWPILSRADLGFSHADQTTHLLTLPVRNVRTRENVWFIRNGIIRYAGRPYYCPILSNLLAHDLEQFGTFKRGEDKV